MPPRAKIAVDLGIYGKNAIAQVKTLSGKINAVIGKITPIAGMVLGAGGAFAIGNAIKKTIDFDMALTRLAIQGHKTASEQAKVRDAIMDVSVATGMSKEQILDASKAVIDSTGDFDFMVGTLESLASLSQTTGSEMGGLGKITGALGNVFKMSAEEANQMMRILVEQGEIGAYTLEEMGTTANKVFAAAYQAGVRTQDELKNFMAYMQVFRTGFSSAEEAATAYKGIVGRLGMESKKLEGMGIRVFDQDTGQMRDTAAIMMDLFEKVGTKAENLNELMPIFGQETFGAVTAMAGAYDEAAKNGNNLSDELKKFTGAAGSAEAQAAKLARMQATTAGKMDKLKTTFDEIMVTTLGTTENMEALGSAAEGAALALTKTVTGIQAVAEWLAEQADKLGMVKHGGRAEDTAKMTPEEIAARQAMHGALAKTGEGAAPLTEQEKQFVDQYEGGDLQKKFMAADPEEMSKTLMKIAAAAAVVGALPLAAAAGGAAAIAPKVQASMQQKAASEFAKEVRINRDDIAALGKAVEKGASNAKPVITAPTPLDHPGGTQGTPVHVPG